MVTALLGVYGAGGCGRGIMPLLRDKHANADLKFVDDVSELNDLNGHSVLTFDEFVKEGQADKFMCLAVASPISRRKLFRKCQLADVSLIGAQAPSVIMMDAVEVKEGACLSPYVTITSNIQIGLCFHANLYSYVEHDCVIGDFVTLAPGAKVNGNVTIGDDVYIGAGAIIRQGLTIGRGAVVGMGAVVTRDVPPGVTVVGNPARPIVKV